MFNETEDERCLVMEYLKAKEDIYTTIKVELDASKQHVSYIENDRENTRARMKTGDILATIVTSGLITSAKKPSAWKKMKLFFRSKLRRREAREEAISNHVEHPCYYSIEVATVLEKLFPKFSDMTEHFLPVGNNEKKAVVKKVTSGNYTFLDDALLTFGKRRKNRGNTDGSLRGF